MASKIQIKTLALINVAENKGVNKQKIINFLKKKGVSEEVIIVAYDLYYKHNGLYEITFGEQPFGFSVRTYAEFKHRKAIVSSIESKRNVDLGMTLGSFIYQVGGRNVEDRKHDQILKILKEQSCPLTIAFRTNRVIYPHFEQRMKTMGISLRLLKRNYMELTLNAHKYQMSWLCMLLIDENICHDLISGYLKMNAEFYKIMIPNDVIGVCLYFYFGDNSEMYQLEIDRFKTNHNESDKSNKVLISRATAEMEVYEIWISKAMKESSHSAISLPFSCSTLVSSPVSKDE